MQLEAMPGIRVAHAVPSATVAQIEVLGGQLGSAKTLHGKGNRQI